MPSVMCAIDLSITLLALWMGLALLLSIIDKSVEQVVKC